MSPWVIKAVAAAIPLALGWWLRARVRDGLNPWRWFSALDWKVKLGLFAMAPFWVASFGLGFFLFGAVFSDALALYVAKRAPEPVAKLVAVVNPSARRAQ